ncbi:MAG: porin [Alphaproteobacteria bacterium]|nr:porin [Alphaproteobacteria bacterium]
MKKLLLLGAAVCSGLVAAPANMTSPAFSLKMSAAVNAVLLSVNQKVQREAAANSYIGIGGNLTAVASSTKDQHDHSYGLIAAIDLDRVKEGVKRIAEFYGFYSTPYGTGFIGGYEGPVSTLNIDGPINAGGCKGPLGFVGRVVDLPVGCNLYLGIRQAPSNKIGFNTVSMNGFVFGISFAPDTGEEGRASRIVLKNEIDRKFSFRNMTEVALNYTKTIDNLTLGAFIGGVFAKSMPANDSHKPSNVNYNPVEGYQVGAMVDAGCVRIAGSFYDMGKSAIRAGLPFTAPKGYSVSAAFTLGATLLSVGYYRTERKVEQGMAETNLLTFSADYQVSPSVTVYAECDIVDAQSTKAHVSEAGLRDIELDKIYDGAGLSLEKDGPVNTKAQVFMIGLKVQC